MRNTITDSQFFGQEKISKILLKIAPPVMLAQLIQALYNIVDSLFIGRFSDTGLTALSIIYPIQLLMIAIATGTGVGINTMMSAKTAREIIKPHRNSQVSEHRLPFCFGRYSQVFVLQ